MLQLQGSGGVTSNIQECMLTNVSIQYFVIYGKHSLQEQLIRQMQAPQIIIG